MARAIDWEGRIGRRLRLRDLHVFFAVVQSGSMAKAAAQLHVKQPSVSKAIGDLEAALGVRLFDRSPQGVRPTIYGDALIECGVAVFDQLKQGIGKIEFLSDPTTAEVRIGCVPSKAGDPSSISHPPIRVGWATRIKSIGSNAKIRLGSRAAIRPIADTAGAAGSATVRRRQQRASPGLTRAKSKPQRWTKCKAHCPGSGPASPPPNPAAPVGAHASPKTSTAVESGATAAPTMLIMNGAER